MVTPLFIALFLETCGTEESPAYRLKTEHTYHHQVQAQLHITNKACCDFVVWTKKDIAIVRIAREASWLQNLNKLIDFYFQRYIPHLQQL